MHAASSFTGSKEARNRLTVDNIDHAALQVSNQAAHAVVNLRAHLSGVPRTFSERRLFVVDVAAECGIALGLYSLLEFSNRSLQRVDRLL